MADEAPGIIPIPKTLTITLRQPVSFGELTCEKLTLREPTGAEMIAVDSKSGWAFEIALISIVSGVFEPLVVKIGAGDLHTARKYINSFFD